MVLMLKLVRCELPFMEVLQVLHLSGLQYKHYTGRDKNISNGANTIRTSAYLKRKTSNA